MSINRLIVMHLDARRSTVTHRQPRNAEVRAMRTRVLVRMAGLVATVVLHVGPSVRAEPLSKPGAERLESMRSIARGIVVEDEEAKAPLKLRDEPVFRYSDQPRGFIDASLWVWMQDDRPAAFQKIEVIERGDLRQWGYCFGSFSEHELSVRWPSGRAFRTTEPGVEFRPLPDAPPNPKNERAFELAARQLAKRFDATLERSSIDQKYEMQLIPRPIVVYGNETEGFRGAVFGFAAGTTNPDLFLALESRSKGETTGWFLAVLRMTNGDVTLGYRDREIWRGEQLQGRAERATRWTFFEEPRRAEPPADVEPPSPPTPDREEE